MVVAPVKGATVQNPHASRARRPRTQSRARSTAHLRRRGLCALALALGALAASAASASAVIVHLRSGKVLSYQPLRGAALARVRPFDLFFSNLDYNGGPIMPSNTNYTIYWDPPGTPGKYETGYQSGVNRYLGDLAHDSGGTENVDSVSAQYNDAAGESAAYLSHFGGTFVDEQPYPANGCTRTAICLTDAQIQAELVRFVAEHELPTDLAHEYFLLTPPKVESCIEASGEECSAGVPLFGVYCAYHGNIPLAEGHELIFANDPYVTGNKGCDLEPKNHPNGPSDGALQGGLSHEHNESITDPEPNNAWTNLVGGEGEAGEIGDKCNGSTGAALGTTGGGAAYNQEINGHFYWYQEEWSNQGNACLQRLAFEGEVPKAAFAATTGTGGEVTFDAGASTAPGGVARYSWQFNDGPEGLNSPAETTSPTFSHTFPCSPSFTVALTVFAADGTSNGTAHSVTVNCGGGPAAPVPIPAGRTPVETNPPAPASPPATPAAVSASVALAASTAQVQPTGRTALKLTCTGTASSCTGRIVLTAKVYGRGHRSHTVTLATASFTIPAGRTSTVTLRLSAQARSLLRAARGHMSAQLALSKSSPPQAHSRSVRLVLAHRH
jgi:hypothetical protein